MAKKSELNQNKEAAAGVSLGEGCFVSGSEFASSEDAALLTTARIRHFAESVLSAEAWFRTADELTAAMDLVGRNVESFWDHFNSIIFAVDMTTDPPTRYHKRKTKPKRQRNDADTKYNLANQHMMLAGFAIENLCKGYLAGLLGPTERDKVKAGKLPKRLKTHDILKLVRSTGITISEQERDLLNRIGDTNWRGRYPSPTGQAQIRPFTQWEDDIARIKTFLPRLRAYVGAKNS
jgi:hypothetical protein